MEVTQCTCSPFIAGSLESGAREWRDYCLEHGRDSQWYNSEEQKLLRAEKAEALRILQSEAREARNSARQI